MTTVQTLKAALYSLLDACTTSSVYGGQVPETATYPYVHFKLPTSNDHEHREDFVLEVQCWDKSYNSSGVETLAQNVDYKLNRSNYNSTGINFTTYRINRITLPSDDEFQGRELKYLVKAYLTT
jgi:hypothetical protein